MIRQATTDDLSVIYNLAHEIWPVTYQSILSPEQVTYMLNLMYNHGVLHKSIKKKEQIFYLLYEQDLPIGFIAIQLKSGSNPLICKLNKIYILQQMQGKGFGKKLIDFAADMAKVLDAAILELNVNRNNTALDFYKKLGFEIIKEVDIPIGNGYLMEDYVLQKTI